MTGLVLELQRDAYNQEIRVSTLLRKALAISKKLGIVEIENWLNKELNGYLTQDEIPKYRIIYGDVKAWNSYRNSWIPTCLPNAEIEELVSKREIDLPIGELESLIENEAHELRVSLPSYVEKILVEIFDKQMQFYLIVGKTKFISILEIVRTNILNWTLELEQQGILGEGMSFSAEEKAKAQHITNHITNNIGSMHNSQLQQDSAHATQALNVTETNQADLKAFVEELKKSVDSLQLAQEQIQVLKEAIAMLEIQANSTKPNNLIIKESGRTVRNILEGMTGSIVASGLIYQLGLFLPT